MDGVTNLIREFSADFEEMKEIERINISNCCAELLFKTIAKDFENKAFDIN